MVQFTAEIERYDGPNVIFKGKSKPLFIGSSSIENAMKNFPVGTIVTAATKPKDIGTLQGFAIPTEQELRSYQADKAVGSSRATATKPPAVPTHAPFKSGKEILQENLEAKIAERKAAEEQTARETAEGDLRMRENEKAVMAIIAAGKEKPIIAQITEPRAEDTIRPAMAKLVASERVGYRISLAGCVNSVIEIHKLNGTKTSMEEVKKEAVELLVWMDQLTTGNLKGAK